MAHGQAVLAEAGGAYLYDGSELQNRRGLLACNAAAFDKVLPVAAQVAREAGLLK
ncbi:hypothetical protein [Corallococcus exiguus]|uniref:hypothetical protein n=1 Tax=Corallococcus exiguus TaxID=83462 RepID=UPI00201662CD|nr:hypothetical protein [Corallococcus exiguus]